MEVSAPDEKRYELPNVAAVPQFSPFRYPGGKSRWYELIRAWVEHASPSRFVEPFAGGAHAGLAVAYEEWGRKMVDEVVLIERDENVAAVWETIFNGEVDWLVQRIEEFEMTREAAESVVDGENGGTKEQAFAMIVHNRVSRGGVTAPGAGWLNDGENGEGLSSRWYPDTLADRIEKLSEVRDRVEFIEGDAFEKMNQYQDASDALFIDPPYPDAGERLYDHSDVDHEQIFALARGSAGPVLLTYDDSEEVKSLVERCGLETKEVLVPTTHHCEKTELLISEDFQWSRNVEPKP